MKPIGSVFHAIFGGGTKPKGTAAIVPTAPVTRDSITEQAALEDALRKRRGGAADILTGPSGAEAGSTSSTTLG